MTLEEIWEQWRDWPGNRTRLWPTFAMHAGGLWLLEATLRGLG